MDYLETVEALTLRTCFIQVRYGLRPRNFVADYLFQEKVISRVDRAKIRAERTAEEQADVLLDCIGNCSNHTFSTLMLALKKAPTRDQQDLGKLLGKKKRELEFARKSAPCVEDALERGSAQKDADNMPAKPSLLIYAEKETMIPLRQAPRDTPPPAPPRPPSPTLPQDPSPQPQSSQPSTPPLPSPTPSPSPLPSPPPIEPSPALFSNQSPSNSPTSSHSSQANLPSVDELIDDITQPYHVGERGGDATELVIGAKYHARATYEASSSECINVSSNQKATLLETSEMGWWKVQSHDTGRIGWVPGNLWVEGQDSAAAGDEGSDTADAGAHSAPPLNDGIPREHWFHGAISRDDAEQLLKEHGSNNYLIRENTSKTGDFYLSVIYKNKIRHFPIEALETGTLKLGDLEFFSLTEVVSYCRMHLI